MRRSIILSLALLSFSLCTNAQSPNTDPIDKTLNDCLNDPKNKDIQMQTGCMAKAFIAWEVKIQDLRDSIKLIAEPEDLLLINSNHKEWQEYYETENRLISTELSKDISDSSKIKYFKYMILFARRRAADLEELIERRK